MNLLCLIGLLAGVWLFNQAVTREELLSDTPAESRDFIDSLHWPAILALIESLSWIQKGNTPSLKTTAGSPAWTQTICQLKRKMKVFPKASTSLDLSSRSITPTSTYPGWHTRNACEVFDWRFHVDLIIKSDTIWKLITPSRTVATTSLIQSCTSEIFTSQKLRDILFSPFFFQNLFWKILSLFVVDQLFQLNIFLKAECSILNKRHLHSQASLSPEWHVNSVLVYTSVDINVVLVPCVLSFQAILNSQCRRHLILVAFLFQTLPLVF